MVVNISQIKRKLLNATVILLPIILGLILNFDMYFYFPNRGLNTHLAYFGLFVILILTGVTSILVFKGNKRIWNYVFSIIGIVYTLIIIYNKKLFNSRDFDLTDIIYIGINIYGLYVVFFGIVSFKNYLNSAILVRHQKLKFWRVSLPT